MRSGILMGTMAAILLGGAPLYAQSWQPPSDAQRCPSKWGAGDQRGAANHMKPETVLRATQLIRTGRGVRARARAVRLDAALRPRAASSCTPSAPS